MWCVRNVRKEVKSWEGGVLHVNAYYVPCRKPNWHERLRKLTHDDVCLSCACKAEMASRGYAPAEALPGGGFVQRLEIEEKEEKL